MCYAWHWVVWELGAGCRDRWPMYQCINGMMHQKLLLYYNNVYAIVSFIYISSEIPKNSRHVDGRDNIRMLVTSTIINFRILLSVCTIENAWLVHIYIHTFKHLYLYVFICTSLLLFFSFIFIVLYNTFI